MIIANLFTLEKSKENYIVDKIYNELSK